MALHDSQTSVLLHQVLVWGWRCAWLELASEKGGHACLQGVGRGPVCSVRIQIKPLMAVRTLRAPNVEREREIECVCVCTDRRRTNKQTDSQTGAETETDEWMGAWTDRQLNR